MNTRGLFIYTEERGGDVATSKGAPQNLKPCRTKEEAKRRGANGGKKSGIARRKKRDAKQAISLLLDMAAQGNLDKNLKQLGFEEEDRTNMNALMARMFTKAMSGDVTAFKALMDYGGFHPDQKLRDKERAERIEALKRQGEDLLPADIDADTGEDDVEDVLVYLPENERDAK